MVSPGILVKKAGRVLSIFPDEARGTADVDAVWRKILGHDCTRSDETVFPDRDLIVNR